MSSYVLASSFSIINDSPEHLDFHIKTGDYFSFLATMLGFIEESLGKCDADGLTEDERKIARELRHDLRYVQAHYKIHPREGDEVEPIRPSGNLLAK